MTANPPKSARAPSSMGIVFLIVFLDIVGFSILFPLFPALLAHYVELEGETGLAGRLAQTLSDLAGGDQHAVIAFFGGVLGAVYSLLQFLFAPFWGGLSDRIGRRPTLLVTLVGTVLAYAMWVFAGSFALLVAARLIGGMMAGNISTASAVIADTTTDTDRVKGMGFIGMAIGLGFILGPAIGALASLVVIGAPASGEGWSAGWALNPFSGPALAATALGVLNLFLVIKKLPETLPPDKRRHTKRVGAWNPLGQVARQSYPGVARTTFISFLYTCAFSAAEFTLTFLAVERLAYSPRDNAWMFVFVGLVIAFVQGGIVRRVGPRVGEQRLTLIGFGLLLPGLAVIAVAGTSVVLYVGLFLMAFGSALIMPCLSALVSRYTPAERQGIVLGQFRSAGSLARAIGPLLGGLLYWTAGSAAPYWAGAAFLLVPFLMARGLPAVASAKG